MLKFKDHIEAAARDEQAATAAFDMFVDENGWATGTVAYGILLADRYRARGRVRSLLKLHNDATAGMVWVPQGETNGLCSHDASVALSEGGDP